MLYWCNGDYARLRDGWPALWQRILRETAQHDA